MLTTLVTWNLKGSAGPDTAAVVAHLRAEGADVVVLQEVQWLQARRIARGLGARSRLWGFKHWPLRTWPEGMAIIGVTVRARGRTLALSHGWKLWSWRRRILQVATVTDDRRPDDVETWTLVNVHLTPHGQIGLRAVETAMVLELVAVRVGPIVVAGDLNERPDGAIHGQLAAAGLRDGWDVHAVPTDTGGDGHDVEPWPTNWRGWRRGTTEPPVRRFDYVYASAGVRMVDVRVPRVGDEGFARFPAISDHLPLTAVFEVG